MKHFDYYAEDGLNLTAYSWLMNSGLQETCWFLDIDWIHLYYENIEIAYKQYTDKSRTGH